MQGNARAAELLAQMTLEEKLAQIVGFWQDEAGDIVAPLQGEVTPSGRLEDAIVHGLGHLTRVYGTSPVEPATRAAWLWDIQRRLVTNTRLGIPAIVHEECLTGLAAWKAATFPTPLAWGAAFDPELVGDMARAIGRSMRDLGIHQGLAPVLDVIRDPRWGRVDECISEDPYLVGTVGTAFVRGLQEEGVHATLKHFVGYSASRAGRNFGPVSAGRRELADIFMVPFEMAIKDGGARSVMHAYVEIDGVPVAANAELLTGVLRDEWGFDGVVVADYFGVAFLHILHCVAADLADAAAQALAAGIDVELPTGDAYLAPLAEAVRAGTVDESLVDRAVLRVLDQKDALGLLDATFEDAPPAVVDLDSEEHRRLARLLAEESVVLLANDGALPLRSSLLRPGALAGKTIAAIGPNVDRYAALFGCYSFANHVLVHHPEVELGLHVPTMAEALRAEFGDDLAVTVTQGCAIDDDDRSGFAAAVAAAAAADVAVIALGDHAGLFGRGTVGEGCDRDDLELPGVQRQLAEAIIATGTPVVLVLLTGRPYAIEWALDSCAAVVQSFFPGEEGAGAIAGVLSGRVNPSGCLPVSMPRSSGAQPYTYLHPKLGGDTDVTNLSSAPALPFGHGLSYTTFDYGEFDVGASVPTDGAFDAAIPVTNTGELAGDHVVQLYAHVRVASMTRPVAQLVGYQRVTLEPGQSATVHFSVPTTRVAFSNREMHRVVEPGIVDLWVGTSTRRAAAAEAVLVGGIHRITDADSRLTVVTVAAPQAAR